MLLEQTAFNACINNVNATINAKKVILTQLQKWAADAAKLEDKDKAADEKEAVWAEQEKANKVITAFKKLCAEICRDWKNKDNCVIGHIVQSLPISLNVGNEGCTKDWAIIQIHDTKISKLNFTCNAIDLGSIAINVLISWIYPSPANPHSFNYPSNCLLCFSSTIFDTEMPSPPLGTRDQDNNAIIMVLKNGNTLGLTIGHLNTIHSFVCHYFEGQPGKTLKEVAILPCTSKSGAFSAARNAGSAINNGKGRICGTLTGGDGATNMSDVTFVTSINFLLKRLVEHGFKANLFPTAANL